MDTLAVRLAVPLIGPAKVFHLLGLRPAGRTKKKVHAELVASRDDARDRQKSAEGIVGSSSTGPKA